LLYGNRREKKMSADNYSKCPKCRADMIKNKKDLIERASEGYGKISADEYNDLLTEGSKPIDLTETLREDYEFYLQDDILGISYSCSCSVCKFHFEYKQDVKVC